MADFLLELLSEEIPARMQIKAKDDLARLFTDALAKAGLAAVSIETFATPRRLALIATDLPLETAAVREETKGPKAGAPPQAMEGFLRKTGLTQDQLVERDGVYFAIVERPGRATTDVLAEAIPAIIRAFPWPKSQRWGAASISTESLRWVRPLQGIVALLGDDVVPCAIEGIVSGRETVGHRFHSSGPIAIANAASYVETLRRAHVIVHYSERCRIIREGAAQAAADAGLTLVEDEGLVSENAGLTEWPVPMLGRFDPAYLSVPEEVIQLTARVNQKYFICRDAAGALANAFVCTANIVAKDGGAAIVAGNEKVLAARLSDAKFFWESDLKIPLETQAVKLTQITFHEKLGTVADKAERVAKLAEWLASEGVVPGCDPALARRAAELCKADLVTGSVGEFPELQGIMGGHLARAQGDDSAVADAIRDHYKPVGQGDDVPTAPVTVAVSLADKLDTLAAFFEIEEFPTGSKDPFALRRAALGLMQLIRLNGLRLHLGSSIGLGWLGHTADRNLSDIEIARRKIITTIPHFILDRIEVLLREAGVRHDFVRASRQWGTAEDGRLDRVENRARALQAFISTDDGANLLAGYKRAANLLKQAVSAAPLPGGEGLGEGAPLSSDSVVHPHPTLPLEGEGFTAHDHALLAALDRAEPTARAAVDAEDFTAAMAALASLRAPIDAFFDGVMVNDPDPDIRTVRLGLLARFRDAVHSVADFSKIEG